MRQTRPVLLILCVVGTATLSAADFKVSSLSALQSAIDGAGPGARIIVANGVYTATNPISITRQGTERRPVLISAETIGGAELNGTAGFRLESPAAWVVIRGFKFTHAVGGEHVAPGANHCRFTRNVFELTGAGHYLYVGGDDTEVDYNTFQNKFTVGQMITVQGPGGNGMAQRTWIHHNFFNNFPDTHQNNCSAIQIGLSGRSMSPARSLVEYNLFLDCRGENENVCNKSCDNVYRFNTFGNNCSELSLRHGNRCIVYGNFFIGSEGVRIFGKDHKIFSNYFERSRRGIHIGNGDALIPPSRLTGHDRPDGVQIVFNTLVNNTNSVMMAPRRNGLGAKDLTFADNIIQGGGRLVSIGGPITNAVWEGNIVWGNSGGADDIPTTGFMSADPGLKPDSQGEYRLQENSPIIGRGIGSYPYVTFDMDGQARGSKLDVGADQFSQARITNRILTPADVGPEARGATQTSADRRRNFVRP